MNPSFNQSFGSKPFLFINFYNGLFPNLSSNFYNRFFPNVSSNFYNRFFPNLSSNFYNRFFPNLSSNFYNRFFPNLISNFYNMFFPNLSSNFYNTFFPNLSSNFYNSFFPNLSSNFYNRFFPNLSSNFYNRFFPNLSSNFYNRRMTVRQIEETLGIPKTTVDRIMREHLGLRKFSARWVPKLLPPDQKAVRRKLSSDNLALFEANPEEFVDIFVTMDETWAHHFAPESKQQYMQWRHSGSPPPKKPRQFHQQGRL
ncbi:hypothetical protein LAZ67_23000321 [Cordylochernes scorpioides]|uniref:Uncharacterized protein n=1 Tax=Cordylochernes scorpioides TaxID=51811 RepID=A0ABY6LPV3_9ARAC|nr:hypothetical protein LAZ67_23000321 [Cordylochernes scorpioides]